MQRVLFISESQIKAESIIEANVDSKVLKVTIQLVQDTILKPILGTSLYNTLVGQIQSKATVTGYTIPSLYKALLDVIQPFLVYTVLEQFVALNGVKIANKGNIKLSDNGGSNLSNEELQATVNFYQNAASQYKLYLIEFLRENKLVEGPSDTSITTNLGWYFLEDYNC
jgi:hypothetical protein